jgi:hypothetical protein
MFLAHSERPNVFDVLFRDSLPALPVRLVVVPFAFVVVGVLVVESASSF